MWQLEGKDYSQKRGDLEVTLMVGVEQWIEIYQQETMGQQNSLNKKSWGLDVDGAVDSDVDESRGDWGKVKLKRLSYGLVMDSPECLAKKFVLNLRDNKDWRTFE